MVSLWTLIKPNLPPSPTPEKGVSRLSTSEVCESRAGPFSVFEGFGSLQDAGDWGDNESVFVSYPQKERNHPPIPLVITDIARDYGNSCNRLGEETLAKIEYHYQIWRSRTVENHSFHIIKDHARNNQQNS